MYQLDKVPIEECSSKEEKDRFFSQAYHVCHSVNNSCHTLGSQVITVWIDGLDYRGLLHHRLRLHQIRPLKLTPHIVTYTRQ